MLTYAISRVKRKGFYRKKWTPDVFFKFPATILVDQNGTIWRLHTKLYRGVWNVSAKNSETMGHKDLTLGKIVYTLVFYNIHFLGFFHRTVSNLFFCWVTMKTIYTWNCLQTEYHIPKNDLSVYWDSRMSNLFGWKNRDILFFINYKWRECRGRETQGGGGRSGEGKDMGACSLKKFWNVEALNCHWFQVFWEDNFKNEYIRILRVMLYRLCEVI